MDSQGTETPIFFAKSQKDIPEVVSRMTEQQLKTRHALLLEVSHSPKPSAPPGGILTMMREEEHKRDESTKIGFIESLAADPSVCTAARLVPGDEGECLLFLFRGNASQRQFFVNEQPIAVGFFIKRVFI